MKKIFTILILAVIGCQFANAKSVNDNTDKIKALEEKCYVLQNKQVKADNNLRNLIENQHVAEREIQKLVKKNDAQRLAIDSLQDKCKSLEEAQSTDRENINGKIDATDNNVRTNQDQLQSRTLYGVIVVIVVLVIIVGVACWLTKRIKSGTSTIGDVRRAQEALQAAQTKMQEESVKLDNQLLAIVQKQLDASSASKITGEPDHSLVVKLADEIARIETNLSKMDKSVRGYKQLVQAKDRMINNVRANGYEIISLLGQEYNDGMQFQTRFVPDESLPEGKRIITGMIKMQVYFPSVDFTVKKELDLSKRESSEDAISWVNKELGSAQRSIEALLSSGISVEELNKELDAVKELASSGNDPMRTQSNLKEVLRKIEELDDSTEWQRVERELREEFDRLEKAQNDLGNDKSAQLVNQIRGQVDNVIRVKDAKLGREILDQISSLFVHLTLVYQCMGLIRDCHNRFGTIRWKDASRARQLINKGLEEINNQPSVDKLHPIACGLIDLMPNEEAVNAGGLLK